MASSPPARVSGPPPGAARPEPKRRRKSLRRFLRVLGPGLITGASDDDPSGIGTYAVAGASLGYAPLWTALVTFPLMAAVQYVCAKIGLVSGRGLADVLRAHYPKALLYPVVLALLVTNTINAGVDLGAIGAALNLFVPVPVALLVVPVTVLILVVQVWGSYRLIARVFTWLTLALFTYVGAAFLARPDWAAVLRGTVVPDVRLDATYLATLVGLLGTTISPYLFFWQANLEVEEEKARGRKRLWQRRSATDSELRYAAWDVNLGMFFSNVVMYFIILATAATLHRAGRPDVGSAADAAEALRPLAGRWAELLFALGLVGSGFLAVPVLTTASAYALCEACRWKQGLNEKLTGARGFYAVIVISTLLGMLINFVGINPMDALFWTAVLNGFLAPPLLVVIMLVSNNRHIMGKRVNGLGINVLGWATTVLMFAAAVGLVVTWHPW
jgi:NRAMP (natural resistance-associated macrophage protein)-like metal ion transporter